MLFRSLLGVSLAPGEKEWREVSDRDAKKDILDVERDAVLLGLLGTPVFTWSYRASSPEIRHMGPMAQDFHAAFGLGGSDKTMTALDELEIAIHAARTAGGGLPVFASMSSQFPTCMPGTSVMSPCKPEALRLIKFLREITKA